MCHFSSSPPSASVARGVKPSRFADRLVCQSIRSTVDGTEQPYRLHHATDDEPRPLLVVLHTWMGDWQQNQDHYLEHAVARRWHCLLPNYRGPNIHPHACASPVAIQDVLDAMDGVMRDLAVDRTRVYLVGGSGGGHMAMMLAATYPERFTAISAWCGITDLQAWRRENRDRDDVDGYARSVEQCIGGDPDADPAARQQALARSPLHVIKQRRHPVQTPLDLNAGVHDGKSGSVPFWHTVWYYNVLAQRLGGVCVTDAEIDALWRNGSLADAQDIDAGNDPSYRKYPVVMRREVRHVRLTIFDGGHNVLPAAATLWLASHHREGDQVIRSPIDPESPASNDSAAIER